MRVFKYISYLVVALSILCLYSWSVYHVSTGGKKLGILNTPLLKFASFPKKVEEVLSSPEVNNIPESYLPIESDFKNVNNLSYDLYGLTSFWDNSENVWEIKLFNFRNDTLIHTWKFLKSQYEKYHIQYFNGVPTHSLLLPNKDIIIRAFHSPNLIRLDANSKEVWHNKELEFHHALNLDADSNLWVGSSDLLQKGSEIYTGGIVKNLDGNLISLREDYITKVDIKSGEVLFKKGIAKILLENGYKGLLYGADLFDPIHLNDIQPVLEDTEHWKKNDLFISIRNRSLVFLYRPSTNKIIALIQGPFVNQHDVDIISNHEISIFNNNNILSRGFDCEKPYMEIDSLNNSEIVIYNFKDSTFRLDVESMMKQEKVISYTGALQERLSNGDVFVEAQNVGKYYIIRGDELIMRKVIYTPDSNYMFLPNWVRLYEELPF